MITGSVGGERDGKKQDYDTQCEDSHTGKMYMGNDRTGLSVWNNTLD